MTGSIPSTTNQPFAHQEPLSPKSARIKNLEESLAKVTLVAQGLKQENFHREQVIQQLHAQNEDLQNEVRFYQRVTERYRNATEQIQSECDRLFREKIAKEGALQVVIGDNQVLVADQQQLERENQALIRIQQQVQIQNNQYRQIYNNAVLELQAAGQALVTHNEALAIIGNKPRIVAACNILIQGSEGFVNSAFIEAQQNNPLNQPDPPQIGSLDENQIEHII